MIIYMTYDIYSDKAVDLVIFTVVEESSIKDKVWDEELIRPIGVGEKGANGLMLFVVTVPADERQYPNAAGKRVLPGGFLGKSETLQEASRRIAQERLGLSLKTKMRQLGIFDDPNRVPNERVLSFAYWAMVEFDEVRKYLGGRDRVGLELVNSHRHMRELLKEQAQISEFGSISQYDGISRFGFRLRPDPKRGIGHPKTLTKDMPGGRILGLDHDEMVFYAWRAMRHAFDGKLDPFRYLGINPLGPEFRLSDLQEFTEVCLGETKERDALKREVVDSPKTAYLRYTGNTDNKRPGKPANLYSLQAPPSTDEY